MSKKFYDIQRVEAGQDRHIILSTQDTNYGFRHIAEMYQGERLIGKAKCCYYNRTWEQYDYQSVIHKVIDGAGVEDAQALKKVIDEQQLRRVSDDFGIMGAIMSMSDLMTDDKAQSADFKLRMLKARFGDAVIVPEDWEDLSDDVKLDRLNKISNMFMEV